MFLAGRFLADDRARTVGAREWVSLQQIPGVVKDSGNQKPRPPAKFRRTRLVLLALGVAALAIWAGLEGFVRGRVDGQIFVTTHGGRAYGGRTYELGQVTVSLFPLRELTEHLRQKSIQANREFANLKQAIAEANAERIRTDEQEKEAREQSSRNRSDTRLKFAMDEAISANRSAEEACAALLRKSTQYHAGACFFDRLPGAIATVQTDENGRFSIKTPSRGDFAIAVKARSPTNPSSAHCWMIPVSLHGKPKTSVVLSNDNRISADSPESLAQSMK